MAALLVAIGATLIVIAAALVSREAALFVAGCLCMGAGLDLARSR